MAPVAESLPSAQVMIPGSWNQLLHWFPTCSLNMCSQCFCQYAKDTGFMKLN
uniref:Uncharacterized protein n=1 Tax=Canis lupus familiaris TaxID=9615 RepID=A0A8C0RJV0_CANLF